MTAMPCEDEHNDAEVRGAILDFGIVRDASAERAKASASFWFWWHWEQEWIRRTIPAALPYGDAFRLVVTV